jgi:heat shock protein HtpX
MPKLYIIPSQSPNAFATGRNPHHAAVAVTDGALNLLSKEELMGVLGHELGHVKHRDILIGSVAATVAGAIMIVASMARWAAIFGGFGRSNDNEGGGIIGLIAVAILAPIAAMLIQMAISRTREYAADKAGAEFSENPLYLANALEKLHTRSRSVPLNAQPQTAHMFIVNPLSGKTLANLFSTHPPIEERIKRLKEMTVR